MGSIFKGVIFHIFQGQNEVNTSRFNYFLICHNKLEFICSLFGSAWSPSHVAQVHVGWFSDTVTDVAVG